MTSAASVQPSISCTCNGAESVSELPIARCPPYFVAHLIESARRCFRRTWTEGWSEALVSLLVNVDQLANDFVFGLDWLALHFAVVRERKQHRGLRLAAPAGQRDQPVLGHQIEKRGRGNEIAPDKQVGRGQSGCQIDGAGFRSLGLTRRSGGPGQEFAIVVDEKPLCAGKMLVEKATVRPGARSKVQNTERLARETLGNHARPGRRSVHGHPLVPEASANRR